MNYLFGFTIVGHCEVSDSFIEAVTFNFVCETNARQA